MERVFGCAEGEGGVWDKGSDALDSVGAFPNSRGVVATIDPLLDWGVNNRDPFVVSIHPRVLLAYFRLRHSGSRPR